jgi:amidohydrolase
MTPSVDELKRRFGRVIDQKKETIISLTQRVLKTPETGFREEKTARLVAEMFAEWEIPHRTGLALTGVKGILRGREEGPTAAVLGELDALLIPDHPQADPQSGAAHACGHHAQIGMLLGTALGFVGSHVLDHLSGRVIFMAVPAEEYIEIEFRNRLRQEGKIRFLAGKQELIRLGEFDDVDFAMMVHSHVHPQGKMLGVGGTSNGMLAKEIRFIGRAAHAGAAPHKGVNALNAAMIALAAIHAQRETFREKDAIRIHPIITQGGEAVNIVPADVRMETFVRGKSWEAIRLAEEKVDRCLRAGALAVGGKVRITTLAGYSPMLNHPGLEEVFLKNALHLLGEEKAGRGEGHLAGSTDMGDVSQILPAIHPFAGGAAGQSHGNDFRIEDYESAVIAPAKVMGMTIIDLLAGGAVQAKEILSTYRPAMTKAEYLALMEGMFREEEYVG